MARFMAIRALVRGLFHTKYVKQT